MIWGTIGWFFQVTTLFVSVLISFTVFLPSLVQLSASSENIQRPLRVEWEEEAQESIEASFNHKKNSNLTAFTLNPNDISKIENATSLAILLAEEAFEINLTQQREISLRPFNFTYHIKLDIGNREEKSSANLGDFEILSLILIEWLSEDFAKEKSQARISSFFDRSFPNSTYTLNHQRQLDADLGSIKKIRRYFAKLTHSDPESEKNSFSSILSDSHVRLHFFFNSFSSLTFQQINLPSYALKSSIRGQILSTALKRNYTYTSPLAQKENLA